MSRAAEQQTESRCPARAFNHRHDAAMASDPWRTMHELNGAPALFYSSELGGHWVATRRAVILEILRNSDLFSNKRVSVPPVKRSVWSIPHHLDPPEHGKYRPIVLDLFSPRVLAPLTEGIREVARTLVDSFAASGACEFVDDFAARMPIEIFMRMAGLPEDRREELLEWVKNYFHGATPEASLDAHHKSVAFLSEWLDRQLRETTAQGHIVPALAKATTANGPLTRDEMLSIAISLFNGGLDTVAAQMTHVMRFLAEHPVQRQQLIDDPALIPDAVEELLRRFSIISIGRSVTRDADFSGIQLRAGDMVLCLLGAAGLDEESFGNSLDVDFKRGNRRQHCAFGSGPHMCPGAPLARLELKIMLEEVLPRLRNLRVPPDATLAYHTGVTLGLMTLPLEWDADRTSSAG